MNFVTCNFGLKSYLWSRCVLIWSVVWFQNKLHSTQFNYHYLHTYIYTYRCVCWYKINVEWFKALKYINIIIEHLYGKSETFHSTWCTKPSWMGRWVINGLTIELCHLFRLGFFRNDNNWLKSAINPSPASAHFIVCVYCSRIWDKYR